MTAKKKAPTKKKTVNIIGVFYEDLKLNPIAMTRRTRDEIDNRSKVREIEFRHEGEKIHVYFGPDKEIVVKSVLANEKQVGEYSGDSLPEFFRTRMRYYLLNLGWSLETIKLFHELKEGTFFSKLNVEGELAGPLVVYTGWRGVLFYYTRRGLGNVCAFYPEDSSIERIAVLPPAMADDLCCMLAHGLCFGCKAKVGPGKFCKDHPHIFRTYAN